MKKILVTLLITGILWSCNSKRHSENNEPVNLIDTAQHHHENNAEVLALNNHAKWKADAGTNSHANNLLTITGNFNNGNDKTLADYQKAGNDLQKELDKMINECRMEGAGHAALHKWLQPLLKQVNELIQSSTTAGAAQTIEGISKQVNLFHSYFE